MTPNLDQERVERAAEAAIAEAVSIDKEVTRSLDEESRRRVTQIIRAAITAYLGDTDTSGWQDIATAPTDDADKDPPTVLLWVEGGGERGQGCEAFGRCYRSQDGSVRGVPSGFHGFKVTHWMPRPTPPASPAHPGKEG